MLLQILSDADPKNVWKVGYYIEKGEYNYVKEFGNKII